MKRLRLPVPLVSLGYVGLGYGLASVFGAAVTLGGILGLILVDFAWRTR